MVTEQEVIRRQTILRPDRFDLDGHTATMKAVVTVGNGGVDKLVYRDVPRPVPGPGEVLLQVLCRGPGSPGSGSWTGVLGRGAGSASRVGVLGRGPLWRSPTERY